jgi:hypothetical protein
VRRISSLPALGAAVIIIGALSGAAAPAAVACPPGCIAAENAKQGTPPSTWDISGAGSPALQGFATDISVNVGSTIGFKVDGTAGSYRIDIYRMGWYGGDGARLITTIADPAVRAQPQCATGDDTGLVDCSNWETSASWSVPADAVSGVYFAHLVGAGAESHIVFVVRDDASHSDVLFQTSDTTWQAYNQYGGHSLYTGGPGSGPSRAYKVSYNRPITTRGTSAEDWVFNSEYPMIRWLERNGYDVNYTTGVDSDRRGALIRNHRVFLSVGHDEYWSGAQRANVEAARDAGVSLAFFSGNEVFWKTRWEDGYRTLVSYKETHNSAKIDPTGVWTGSWRDPRAFNPEGGHPENALTGNLFMVNSGDAALEVPPDDGLLRLWRASGVAAQAAAGQTATLTPSTVGYEWDEDVDNGARPPGLVDLSSTTVANAEVLQDYGHTYGPGSATHHLTLYRAANGAGPDALVFGAGTVQWSWGLDSSHDRGADAPDASMQQATVNLMADMGVQPDTLQAGLSRASASTDTVAPSAFVTTPAGGEVEAAAGEPIRVSGTATDAGGGRVGAVEVSVDGGASWHPAVGRESWSYTWTPAVSGRLTVRVRAADDSGNLGPPPVAAPGGAGGGSGSSGGSRRATAVRITPRTIRVSRRGIVALRVVCPRSAGRCQVTLRLALRGRRVASRTLAVAGGKSRTFRLKLSRAARRELARRRSLRVRATAVSRNAAGDRAVTRLTIRLLAPRRH